MSQGSYFTARNLSEIGDEYRQLLGDNISDGPVSVATISKKHDNFVWTRVMSLPHFAVSGCLSNSLEDDLLEAHEELAALKGEAN